MMAADVKTALMKQICSNLKYPAQLSHGFSFSSNVCQRVLFRAGIYCRKWEKFLILFAFSPNNTHFDQTGSWKHWMDNNSNVIGENLDRLSPLIFGWISPETLLTSGEFPYFLTFVLEVCGVDVYDNRWWKVRSIDIHTKTSHLRKRIDKRGEFFSGDPKDNDTKLEKVSAI